MQVVKKVFLFILICLINATIVAQVKSIGTPFIHNYTRSNYLAGSQNWTIEQGNNDMMYFANNNGLLEFDGSSWKVYTLPNKRIVRSIKMGREDLLFAGGYNEIGYYKLGKMGGASYHSLNNLVPEEDLDFRDVWRINVHPDGIIFQTFNQLMFYKDDMIKVIHAPSSFHFSFLVHNEYYVNDQEKGLMRYAMGNLYPLIGLESLKGKEICGMLSLDNKLLIATASEGVYIYDGNSLKNWNTESNIFLKQNQIYCSSRLSDNTLAFGTIQNGLLVCDNNGNPLQHINMEDGLQNNTILSTYHDNFGNLWLGTDLGIDHVEINSPLSQLSFNYGLSTGYTAIEFDGNLYLGTNQGLFFKSLKNLKSGEVEAKKMNLIEGTRGQVWTLNEIDGHLFCGHHNGTFLIQGTKAKKITSTQGGWTFLQTPGDSSKIIGGNYLGFALYEKKNNRWQFIKQLNGFSESARILSFDKDGSLWMAHGYQGIFHLFFNESYDSIEKVDMYNDQNSNLSSSDATLANIDGEIIFTSHQDIYTFSPDIKDFLPEENWKELIKGKNIRSIKQDKIGNIWYFQDKKANVLRLREDGNYSNISLPFQHIKDEFVKGFEFVYPMDEQNVFFGAENGFIHYNPSINKKYDYQFQAYIRSMRTYGPDSVYQLNSTDEIVLDYDNNDIEFILSANDYENPEQVLYSTFMQGYNQDWSDWQIRSTRDFTNLNEGKYVFRVKSKNIYGTITEEVTIGFRVLPPFHRSFIAYILYGFAVIVLIVLFGFWLKKRFHRAKLKNQKEQEELFRRKEEEFQREALESEKQLIKMRNEKLRAEMKMKDKELANQTLQMIQNNKFLISQRRNLEQIASKMEDPDRIFEIKNIIKKNNKAIESENQWKLFETHFENVHEEFLKRIKVTFPELTPIDLKLCAYLRMNISSKEIAVLMNISVRGVEISRYRLRKKLNLSRNINLTEFIITF